MRETCTFRRNPFSCYAGPDSWQFAQNSKVYREFDLFLRFLPGEVFTYYRIYVHNDIHNIYVFTGLLKWDLLKVEKSTTWHL